MSDTCVSFFKLRRVSLPQVVFDEKENFGNERSRKQKAVGRKQLP